MLTHIANKNGKTDSNMTDPDTLDQPRNHAAMRFNK
jgi:hypothetical protein